MLFFTAALFFSLIIHGKTKTIKQWIPSSRCLNNLYSEEELDRAQENFLRYSGNHPIRCHNASYASQVPTCARVIHSCDSNEMAKFNLTRPRPLEWHEIMRDQVNVTAVWKDLYDNELKNKSLTFIGDSLMMEVYAAMMLTLVRGGANCHGKRCENGFTSYRPYKSQISEDYEKVLVESDIVVINFGLHYNDPRLYDKEMKEGIPHLVDLIERHNKTVLWIDSFIPHFPVPDGSYVRYKQLNQSHAICTINTEINDWRNAIADKHIQPFSNKIKRVLIRDIAASRHDTHNGILTHFSASNLDCLHHCMQPCFWEAILFRLANALKKALI
eukprot:gene9222-10010_t